MAFIWLVIYVMSVLFANIYLDYFIKIPIYGILSFGTIFFAAVFTIRDRLHNFGLKFVFCGIFFSLLNVVLFSIYNHIEVRYIVASFISILVSELTDTMIFQKFINKSWAFKVITSNLISVPLDSILFSILAFIGILSFDNIVQIIVTDVIVKYLISILFALQPMRFLSLFNKSKTKSAYLL